MSFKIDTEQIDVKRLKLEDNHGNNEKLTSFGANCRNSVVDNFKNKCMKYFTKQLGDKNVPTYNIFNNTGEMI